MKPPSLSLRDQGAVVLRRDAAFVTTRWSLVLRVGNPHPEQSATALEALCRAYWYPIYACIRRQGKTPHQAQDLTQEFFLCLIESNSIGTADPDKGRFRSFLIASLRHFLANEWKHSQRQKRGGGQPHFSLVDGLAEGLYQKEPGDGASPEKEFERRWAETLLQRVLDQLQAEWDAGDRNRHFDDLKPFLIGGENLGSMAEAAGRLGVTEASLKWAVHTLRKRCREILRKEVAQTVSSPEEIDDEIHHLFVVLVG